MALHTQSLHWRPQAAKLAQGDSLPVNGWHRHAGPLAATHLSGVEPSTMKPESPRFALVSLPVNVSIRTMQQVELPLMPAAWLLRAAACMTAGHHGTCCQAGSTTRQQPVGPVQPSRTALQESLQAGRRQLDSLQLMGWSALMPKHRHDSPAAIWPWKHLTAAALCSLDECHA